MNDQQQQRDAEADLGRVAEESATARLEAWANASPGDRWFNIRRLWVDIQSIDGSACVTFRCPSEYANYRSNYKGCTVVVVGSDDQPATLDQMIDVALAKWKELYGK